MKELVWFNVSVLYSAVAAGLAVALPSGGLRSGLVFLAVHGGLWAIYRALALVRHESKEQG